MNLHDALRLYSKLRGVNSKRYSKTKKLREETRELAVALKAYKKRPTMANKSHLMEEVADVQWCVTAIAERGGFTVEEALEFKTLRDKGRNIR